MLARNWPASGQFEAVDLGIILTRINIRHDEDRILERFHNYQNDHREQYQNRQLVEPAKPDMGARTTILF